MQFDDILLRAARRLTHEDDRGRWRIPDMRSELRACGQDVHVPDLRPDRGPLSRLVDAGEVRVWPAGRWTEYQAVVPMNLREILERAKGRISVSKKTRTGSRSGHDPADRRHHFLTRSQYRDARTAARLVGRHFDASDPERGMEQVGRRYFVWNPRAGKGTLGDWDLLSLLERAAAAEGKSRDTTQSYKGSLRTLLDLAATREWIQRTEVHNPEWTLLPPEWAAIYEEWRAKLKEAGRPGARGTALALLRAASRCGADDPRDANWADIIEELEARWKTLDVSRQMRSKIRAGYRELRAREAVRGPAWSPCQRRIEESLPIVTQGACREVGRMYGRDGHRTGVKAALRGEPLAWPGAWPRFEALVDGAYGLRQWVLQRSTSPDEQQRLGLPERTDRPLRPATITNKLAIVTRVAGFLADRFGVDWTTHDLRELFQRRYLEAWHEYHQEDTSAGDKTRDLYLSNLGFMAGASLAPLAALRGDTELVRQFEAAHALLSGDGLDGRISLADRARVAIRDDPSMIATMRAASRRVERTWTRNGEVAAFAYDQMSAVGRCALSLIEADYGPLQAQLDAIMAERCDSGGRYPIDWRWAVRIRDALIWWDQLVVPYRTKAIVELDRQDRMETPDFTQLTGKVHAWKRKRPHSEWHEPNYRRSAHSPYPTLLYRLFVVGARERLLTDRAGNRWKPDPSNLRHHRKPAEGGGLREPFYPNRLANSKRARMGKRTAADAIKRVAKKVLEQQPDVLGGISYSELTAADRVLVPHAFRHAVAKKMLVGTDATEDERRGRRLDAVCRVLDHGDPSMVWSVYAGTDESDYDVGAMACAIGGNMTKADAERRLNALLEQLAANERQCLLEEALARQAETRSK